MRWNIWDEMQRMQQDMDRMFDGFNEPKHARALLAGPSLIQSNYRQPLADIWETDKEVVAAVELPGVDKEDIKINIMDDAVEIKVEKSQEKKEEKKGMYRLERSYTGFYRCIPVPDNVDAEKIAASYKNGVLELRMPKSEQAKKIREIKVN